MNMTDRERLIDLMIDAKRTDPETGSFTEYLADYLLEHGVIVPPCKAGDMVYMVTTLQKEELIFENIIKRVVYDAGDFAFDGRAIGKTVFLTREEAEQALKERENNG